MKEKMKENEGEKVHSNQPEDTQQQQPEAVVTAAGGCAEFIAVLLLPLHLLSQTGTDPWRRSVSLNLFLMRFLVRVGKLTFPTLDSSFICLSKLLVIFSL